MDEGSLFAGDEVVPLQFHLVDIQIAKKSLSSFLYSFLFAVLVHDLELGVYILEGEGGVVEGAEGESWGEGGAGVVYCQIFIAEYEKLGVVGQGLLFLVFEGEDAESCYCVKIEQKWCFFVVLFFGW